MSFDQIDMKDLSIRLAVLLGSLVIARAASAQVQMPMQGQGLNAALMKLLGDTKAFSARTEFLVRSGAETTIIPMGFALLDGKMRMEVDMAQVKGKEMPAETLAMFKQIGMDRMVNIIIPEKKIMWIIYPALKAYAEMPALDEAVAGGDKDSKIELTEISKETVDGRECMKKKFVLTDNKGNKREGLTWNAKDLKGFPVRMEFADGGATVTMAFKNIKLAAPDRKQFDAPAGYRKHSDIQELMKGALQRTTPK
ncbi:MAG: DUF4412 domain-containing protein [Verrucomicrobiota bacterium]